MPQFTIKIRKDAEKEITTKTIHCINDLAASVESEKHVSALLSKNPRSIFRFSVKNNESRQKARLSEMYNGRGFGRVSGDFHFEKESLFQDLL